MNRSYHCHSRAHSAACDLELLCEELRALPEIAAKRAIRHAASLTSLHKIDVQSTDIGSKDMPDDLYTQPGDDCAAFKQGDGYQLLAMEGMLPSFVASDPRAAGWSSVMVNVSDIAAMGGRPIAIANAFWHNDDKKSLEILHHIKRACDVFGVCFSGGHSSIGDGFSPNLAVAITGYAKNLLSCHHLRPGQRLFILSDLTGSWHGDFPYWGCVQGKSPEDIRMQWGVLAQLAEDNLVVAAKDISNGGVLGTLIMMLELTGCGAELDLNAIPRPQGSDLKRWLRAFQSFGFLLVVEHDQITPLLKYFNNSHLCCRPVGNITDDGEIVVDLSGARVNFWNVNKDPLTELGVHDASC